MTPMGHVTPETRIREEMQLSQSGWLNGWQYRKSHTITGSAGAGTDYQIRIIVHRTTGSDRGENVYVGTNCQINFGDIRFTEGDGLTELDYWLEEYTESVDATFWVEVTDDLGSNQEIYAYYGTSETSTTTSNGDDVFLFYADHSSGSLDLSKWDVGYTNGGVSFSTTDANHGYVAQVYADFGYFSFDIQTDDGYFTYTCAMFRAKIELTTAADQLARAGWIAAGQQWFAIVNSHSGDSELSLSDDDDNAYSVDISDSYFDSYQTYELQRNSTHVSMYSDRVHVVSVENAPDASANRFGVYVRDSEYDVWHDWIAIRKFITIEPSHSSWGGEELSIISTTTEPTTSGTSIIPGDPMSTFIPLLGLAGIISIFLIGGLMFSQWRLKLRILKNWKRSTCTRI
jgi:hypothetical protein